MVSFADKFYKSLNESVARTTLYVPEVWMSDQLEI